MAVSQLERAYKAWPVLLQVAQHRSTTTYGELGAAIGIHHRTVRFVLGVIQSYCLEEGLPPLTILIVNASGKPGSGFVAYDLEYFQSGLEQVWDFNWNDLDNPFDFAESGETAKSLIDTLVQNPDESEGVYTRIKSRGIKQALFRDALIRVYKSMCAFTELSFLEGLEACHIVPWSISTASEKLDVRNGILLNSFHHKLFDKGFITINKEHQIIYCDPGAKKGYSKMDKAFTTKLHGKNMRVPFKLINRPGAEYIARHHELLEWDIE